MPASSCQPQGPANVSGDTNYYLHIYDATGQSPLARLWLLDTGDKGCGGVEHSWWVWRRVRGS